MAVTVSASHHCAQAEAVTETLRPQFAHDAVRV